MKTRPAIRPLPKGASHLEQALAKVLAQTIATCREALTDDNDYSEEFYDELEQRMLDSADKLGRLRQHVTERLRNKSNA